MTMLCTNAGRDAELNLQFLEDPWLVLVSLALILYWVYDWFRNNNRSCLTGCCDILTVCCEILEGCWCEKMCVKMCGTWKQVKWRFIQISSIFPPHILMPKLWFYIAFTWAWSYYVINNELPKNNIVGFVSSVLTPIAVALGLILSDSLTKHHEAIRLYDVYTGDIVAFAMEILAFVENAGYKDASTSITALASASAIVRWKLNNLSANNYSPNPSSINSVREEAVELLQILNDFDTRRRAALPDTYTWATFWTTFLQADNTKYPKNKDFFNNTRVDMSNPQTLTSQINRQFKIPNGKKLRGQVLKQLPLLTTAVNQETQPWLNDPLLARQNFLLSMERIFQTLYVLPQVAKLELRDAISTSNKFDKVLLKTMDVRYCNQNNPTIPFQGSRIVGPYTKITDVITKLNGDKGLTFTQLFLQTLLDYVNELHRTIGGETQTRRTLSTAWRRLYGTYGDMVTVRTYKLPRIISITMEIALVFSSLVLPFSLSFVSDATAIVLCVFVQVVFVGLFVGVETVRNPFVATEDAIGFANVSKAAKAAQEGVRELWFVRGVIQQVDPVSLDFICSDIETGGKKTKTSGEHAAKSAINNMAKKNGAPLRSDETKDESDPLIKPASPIAYQMKAHIRF